MSFLPETFPKNLRTYGLYRPSHGNLELADYRAKRINPNWLFGPEHDPDLCGAVKESAQGVRIVEGSVQDAVNIIQSEGQDHLTFANLDFDGAYNTYVEQILSVFRVMLNQPNELGYLGVTSFAAREHGLTQGMNNISKFYSGLDDFVGFHTDLGRMRDRYASLGKMLTKVDAEAHSHLARELGFLWWMVVGMGMISYDGQDGYGRFDDQYLSQDVGSCLAEIDQKCTELKRGRDFVWTGVPELAKVLTKRRVCLWPTELVHIMHYTQRNQPMQTWFLKFWRVNIEPDGETVQNLLRQIWELAVRSPLLYIDRNGRETSFE